MTMKTQPEQKKRTSGRPELLTQDMARAIAELVKRMPRERIPVTWANIIAHTKKKFGHEFHRTVLSQKSWDGRKLIAEAFDEAKSIQRRLHGQEVPKYTTASRAVLQRRVAELEARLLALSEALEVERARHYDEFVLFLSDRPPWPVLVERHAVAKKKG
jgi:hypothetical protein